MKAQNREVSEVSEEGELHALLQGLTVRMVGEGLEPQDLISPPDLGEESARLRKLLGAEPAVGLAAWSCFARRWTDRPVSPLYLPLVPGEDRHAEIRDYRNQPPLRMVEPELLLMDITGAADFLHIGRYLSGALLVVSPALFVEGAPARVLGWAFGETFFHQADPVAETARRSTGRMDLPSLPDFVRALVAAHGDGRLFKDGELAGYDVADVGTEPTYRENYPWPLDPALADGVEDS